ncbi:MAG: hypothetical protein U0821_15485 [Chloroflexota bacterium]
MSVMLVAGVVAPASAQQDPCPEPNDDLQAACYLGPGAEGVGYLARPDDVDAYRFEVLDFNVDAQVELLFAPFAYRITLADWNGRVVGRAERGALLARLQVPGSYFILVDSPDGSASADLPYRLVRRLTYPGRTIPQILYTGEFRPGENTINAASSELADHEVLGGRYTIAMKAGGDAAAPANAWAAWGQELTDFTLSVDTRASRGDHAGYQVFFRQTDEGNAYVLTVDLAEARARLTRVARGEYASTPWRPVDVGSPGDVVRTVIRCAGPDIRVNVNGATVIESRDETHARGRFALGAITWSVPATVQFDNVMVTTPSEG